MSTEPLVSIIIANYNGEAYLKSCLKSIEKTQYSNYEIIIVDDGSTDKSITIIKDIQTRNNRIKLERNDNNMGAAASRNKALKYAAGDVYVFLDNDTEVTPSWISELIEVLYKDKKTGAVQALLMDYEKRELIQNAGVLLWAQTGWGLPDNQWKNNDGQLKEKKIIAISACLAVKKEVIDRTGGFDEKEAVTTEDLDLSWRIWVAGYEILLAPNAIVYHWTKSINMRKSMKTNNTRQYFHLTKNSLTSILKNYELQNACKYFLYSLYISFGRALLVLIKRKDFSAVSGTVQATLWTISNIPYILNQRSIIQKGRKTSDKMLCNSVIKSGSPRDIYAKYFSQSQLI